MKKVIIYGLVIALLASIVVLPTQAESVLATEQSDTGTDVSTEYTGPSFFDGGRLPEIRLIDRHFKSYYDAGVMDEKPELMPGDVNIDGTIDATDALFAMIYGLGVVHWISETGYIHHNNDNPVPNNIFYRGFYRHSPGGENNKALRYYFENYFIDYYTKGQNSDFYIKKPKEYYYRMNSILMADVNFDDQCNAEDALLILQYAVDKIDAFPRTDCSDTEMMFYIPWPDEWEPGMLCKIGESYYEDLVWPPED